MDRDLLLAVTVALAFVAVAMLVWAAAGLVEARWGRRATALERQIRRVEVPAALAGGVRLARELGAQLPAALGRVEHWLPLRRLELLLLRAGSRHSVPALLGLMALLALAGCLFGLLLGLGLLVTLALTLLAPAVPPLWLAWLGARRRARFEAQFPEAMDFMARALRAGHGLMAGLGMVAGELRDPAAGEFATVFEEVNFGVPVGEALARMAVRVDSRDLDFFVVAVSIQRETGGNLAELLGGLAHTVRERMKLAGKVRALSAEGRLSGVLMTALPFALGGVFSAINPDYMSVLWTDPAGRQVVALMLAMMLIGGLWIRALVRIRV
ncbi:MAG: hypothetical protein FGM40_06680 [Rhodocyclaceae bacterium]|nr:hypothetical protein [Rhodocyclaceae bacterium]